MAKAKNMVIAGEYEGNTVQIITKTVKKSRWVKGTEKLPSIILKVKGFNFDKWERVDLTSENVEAYELLSDSHEKSAASGIARGIIGGAMFGAAGVIAGSASAKTKGIYNVAVQFKDGKKSLLEVDENTYNEIVRCCF